MSARPFDLGIRVMQRCLAAGEPLAQDRTIYEDGELSWAREGT